VIALSRIVTGKTINVTAAPRRAGDPPRLVADASLASTGLKWRPAHSDPENIIRTAWRWMTEHRNGVMK
jgi:UDP-glucose 4-epimerase